jgi:UDP-glucose 4-epimerase
MANKKTCIVGGLGFIGSSLIPHLLENNRDVIVVGRSRKPKRSLPKDVKYFFGDIKDNEFTHNFLKNTDEIIYLAYATTPRTSYENLFDDLYENLIPAITFFDAASQYPIKKIIYISSGGAVYGESNRLLPITEKHQTNPISPYGISKLTIEKYAQLLWRTKKLPIVCIRPSNVYGENQKTFIGQGFISTAIGSILSKREIIIYGKDGTVRDYLYIDDFIKALVLALDKCLPGEIYNLGSGQGFNNNDIINKLKDNSLLRNYDFKIIYEAARASDVLFNVLDTNKFKHLCNWQPSFSIDQGIERLIKYYLRSLDP